MADMLQDATEWLSATLGESAARTITYTRGAYSATITTAQLGRTLFRLQDQTGLGIKWGERDYIFPAADLVLNSVVVAPAVGDRISDSVDSMVYEVRAPNRDEPAFRASDPAGTDWRVHTVRVS